MLPIPFRRALAAVGMLACSACVGTARRSDAPQVPAVFYTVTAEIALSRHQPRRAALQYAAAAQGTADTGLLRRAAEVTWQTLQPSLTETVAAHWLQVEPASLDAQRSLARAALDLDHIEISAAHYRTVLENSPLGIAAEFAALEREFALATEPYAARRVADRLAQYFPASTAALRLQAFTALRADDPAAAVRGLSALQTKLQVQPPDAAAGERRELLFTLWRAQILAGDTDAALTESGIFVAAEDTPENRLDHALLLVAARQVPAAREELTQLLAAPATRPAALRLLGLLDFRDGDLAQAESRFAALVATGNYLDDALYYSGLIAERHDDHARAIRLFAQVRQGDDALPAMLRAATILRSDGAPTAADELLDRLVQEQPQSAPQILAARARASADAGDAAAAFATLEQAREQYPDSTELRYTEASIWEEHGRLPAALHELKEVLAARPGDPTALNAYGYTLADHGSRLAEAQRHVESAHAAAPKNAAILDSLGWVLFRRGRGQAGLPYLTEAYAESEDVDTAAHLGEVLWSLGRRPEAQRIWMTAAAADADNRLLKMTVQRLEGTP